MSDNMTVLRDSTKEPVNQFDIQLQLFMGFFKAVFVLSGGISQLIRVEQHRILSCFICQSLKILKLYHGSKLPLAFYIMSSYASSQG